MIPFKTILVACDFPAPAHHAMHRAALLASQHGAGLSLLHVVDPARAAFAARPRDTLQRMADALKARHGVTAATQCRPGDLFEELLRASAQADLLVLGQRPRSPLADLFFGRVMRRLVQAMRRPLLVVRQPAEGAYRRALVPVDFTPASDAATLVAVSLAPMPELHLLHAMRSQREAVMRDADVPEHVIRESRLMEEAGATARMRRQAARLGLGGLPMTFALAHGPALRSTLRHARAVQAAPLVAGRQARSTLAALLLGSFGSRLLSGSGCDLLLVPSLRREAPPIAASAPANWLHATARFMSRRTS